MKKHNDSIHQDTTTHRQLTRRMRLVAKLVRMNMGKVFQDNPEITRGEAKAASRALDERITAAVSQEDLATTLETLEKIGDALGGRDALPLFGGRASRFKQHRPHGRGHFHGEPTQKREQACDHPAHAPSHHAGQGRRGHGRRQHASSC